MLRFTDSHCHLDFDAFTNELAQLLEQCQQAKIHRIIIPSIGPKNWHKALTLAKNHSTEALNLQPCLGIHPWFLDDLTTDSFDTLAQLVQQQINNIVAIGEAGIDGVIDKEQQNLSLQIEVFEQQLSLAKNYNLPIIVHHRRSHQHIVPMLRKKNLLKGGIIHAFSGSYQQAVQYIDLGFKLGIGGTITYPRAPAMPLYGFQGQNNSPLQLIKVFQALTSIRSESATELAHALENNINAVLPTPRAPE